MNEKTPFHVKRSVKFLQNRFPKSDLLLIGSFRSYITGLKYHKYVEQPSKGRIYLCVAEPHNKYDKNCIAVYANQQKIGYVPRDLSKKLSSNDMEITALLCYCLGNTTEFSSQCIYNIFKVTFPTNI
jgi:hypothetical protein